MAHDRERRSVKQPPGKKAARLSEEERQLWEHTARSINPIKGKKGRVHAALEDAEAPLPPRGEPPKPVAAKKSATPAPPAPAVPG